MDNRLVLGTQEVNINGAIFGFAVTLTSFISFVR